MNRNEMIKWLQENTTQEQWSGNLLIPRGYGWKISREHEMYKGTRTVVQAVYPNIGDPILLHDVFEQPVFIDGAEYVLHFNDEPPRNAWYKLSTNEFQENMNCYPASGFGKNFTVELVPVDMETLIDELKSGDRTINNARSILKATTGQPPERPDYILTGKGNINALSNYLKMNNASVDIVAGEALSRLKAQNSLYERVVKALGERKVPIGGIDHLVGQVQVDHKKATLLDKVIEEFKIPDGGNVINWLHNRTEQTPVPTTANLRAQPRNKYDREILPGVHVDVYDVLEAFNPQSKAIDHAVKKLLAPGQRGAKDRITDLNEAINSIQREIERLGEWEVRKGGFIPDGVKYRVDEYGPERLKHKPTGGNEA